MKLRLIAAAILAISPLVAQAATIDYGAYSVTYDDTTLLQNPSFNSSGSGNAVAFGWNLPASLSAVNGVFDLDLPTLTITANSGYTLAGLTASLGNLSYTAIGNATVTASAQGLVSVDGGPSLAFGGMLGKTATVSGPGYELGYLSGSSDTGVGAYASLLISGSLHLAATGGTFAAIAAQPQNELKFSFTAVPVPEPQNWAMMLGGLAIVGAMIRRRRY